MIILYFILFFIKCLYEQHGFKRYFNVNEACYGLRWPYAYHSSASNGLDFGCYNSLLLPFPLRIRVEDTVNIFRLLVLEAICLIMFSKVYVNFMRLLLWHVCNCIKVCYAFYQMFYDVNELFYMIKKCFMTFCNTYYFPTLEFLS